MLDEGSYSTAVRSTTKMHTCLDVLHQGNTGNIWDGLNFTCIWTAVPKYTYYSGRHNGWNVDDVINITDHNNAVSLHNVLSTTGHLWPLYGILCTRNRCVHLIYREHKGSCHDTNISISSSFDRCYTRLWKPLDLCTNCCTSITNVWYTQLTQHTHMGTEQFSIFSSAPIPDIWNGFRGLISGPPCSSKTDLLDFYLWQCTKEEFCATKVWDCNDAHNCAEMPVAEFIPRV